MMDLEKTLAAKVAEAVGCPCNYSPLDEHMLAWCGEDCNGPEDNASCWLKAFEMWWSLKDEQNELH